MLDIDSNIENYPILKQIYDILAELHNQGRQITLSKIPAHMGIKGKEEANNRYVRDVTKRLSHTDHQED